MQDFYGYIISYLASCVNKRNILPRYYDYSQARIVLKSQTIRVHCKNTFVLKQFIVGFMKSVLVRLPKPIFSTIVFRHAINVIYRRTAKTPQKRF